MLQIAYQIKGNEAYNMLANILLLNLPLAPWVGSKDFFSEEDYVAYHIMQLKCVTLCTSLTFWVG